MTPKPIKTPPPIPSQRLAPRLQGPITCAIDIGGSGLKAMLLDVKGQAGKRAPARGNARRTHARAVLTGPGELRTRLPDLTASQLVFRASSNTASRIPPPILHPRWMAFRLQKELEKRWKKPVRVANDAAVQGYGADQGRRRGTGPYPRHRPGLIPLHRWPPLPRPRTRPPSVEKKTYEDYLGRRGLDKYGKKPWNKLLQAGDRADFAKLFNWDHLYLGGGNTKKITFDPGPNVTIVSNQSGITGRRGALAKVELVWRQQTAAPAGTTG